MKLSVWILGVAVVALSGVIGWLTFAQVEQQNQFESLVSRFNALEEGVAMQREVEDLSEKIESIESAFSEDIEKLKSATTSKFKESIEVTRKIIRIESQLRHIRDSGKESDEITSEMLSMMRATDEEVSRLRKALLMVTDLLGGR